MCTDECLWALTSQCEVSRLVKLPFILYAIFIPHTTGMFIQLAQPNRLIKLSLILYYIFILNISLIGSVGMTRPTTVATVTPLGCRMGCHWLHAQGL